jgi:hypothetical protein
VIIQSYSTTFDFVARDDDVSGHPTPEREMLPD